MTVGDDNNRRRAPLSRTLLGVLSIGLLAAGCSSDAKKAADTTPVTVGLATATTVELPKTTTSTKSTSTTTSSTETATTVAADPTYPLTGMPITDIVVAGRVAVVVKIDNHPDARPQNGLNEADIVFEENVEHLTRFAMVFQSGDADTVGPIRSGRTQDVNLLGSFNKPLFVWSGGNRRVTDAIVASDLREISPTSTNSPFFRTTNRAKPQNLYAKLADLRARAPFEASAPPQQFAYRAAGAAAKGEDIGAAKLSMDGVRILWQWDNNSGTFLRFSDDKVHNDAIGNVQVNTNNVVVLYLDYVPSPADRRSPEAQTTGTGEAWVFSAGKLVKGTWTRNDRLATFTLVGADGTPMLLTPGRTFVELARAGAAASVPAGTDPASIRYP